MSWILRLTLSRRESVSRRNQSIDLLCRSMDWFLHDGNLRHERINKFKIHNKYIEEMSIDVILIFYCQTISALCQILHINQLFNLNCTVSVRNVTTDWKELTLNTFYLGICLPVAFCISIIHKLCITSENLSMCTF